jgi:hypothetical protein
MKKRRKGREEEEKGEEEEEEENSGRSKGVEALVTLTSELPGKMGWFIAQVVVFKAPRPSVEEPESQPRRQDLCDSLFWKAREAEVAPSATSHGDGESKGQMEPEKVWLPGLSTPSGRTSQMGSRR